MKCFLSFLFLIISFITIAIGQNWAPINAYDKYNYKTNQSDVITNTIFAESIKVENGDSVFYLNNILKTFSNQPYNAIRNYPQFLQRKMIKQADGIYNFRDFGNFVIKTKAGLGDSWLFDSLQNINAQVISVGIDTIFGNVDSIKVIQLSSDSLDLIKISKNHGILRFPNFSSATNQYYLLVGFETRRIGQTLPVFKRNFNVGDKFEYISGYAHADFVNDYQLIEKYEVVNKEVNGNKISYHVKGLARYESFYSLWHPPYYGSDYTLDSIDRSFTEFISDSVATYYPLEEIIKLSCYYYNEHLYHFWELSKDSGLFTLSYGPSCYQSIGNSPDTLKYDYSTEYLLYKVDFGLIKRDYSCFETGEYFELTAYQTQTDSMGTFTPDSLFFIGIEEKGSPMTFDIYPNPVQDKLFIESQQGLTGKVQLFNTTSQLLLEKPTQYRKTEIDLHHLSQGVYFLNIQTDYGELKKKIIRLN